MNAALFLIIGVAVLIVGYIFYGGWLAKKWGVDNSRVTPAHELEDGKDYCPAKANDSVCCGTQVSSWSSWIMSR